MVSLNNTLKVGVLICTILLLQACEAVRPYQKQYLNDSEMQLSSKSSEQFETNFHNYREAASGANDGKTGGGCGCN